MTFLERLLDGAGVEWVPLGKVTEYSPTRIDAAEVDASTFVGVDNLVADKGGRVDATYLPNTARLTGYEAGDILIGNIRPYLKKYGERPVPEAAAEMSWRFGFEIRTRKS